VTGARRLTQSQGVAAECQRGGVPAVDAPYVAVVGRGKASLAGEGFDQVTLALDFAELADAEWRG
jgi:hypothetical protein